MNKLLVLITAIFMVVIVSVGLAIVFEPAHVHDYAMSITEPTCVNDGAEVYTCECGDHFSISILAKGHVEETLASKEATCTTDGLTEGKKCSVCNETLVAQQTISTLGHDIVVSEAIEVTCTTNGYTRGEKCTVCDYQIAQEVIPAPGHSIVYSEAVEPTCHDNGYTAGEHCSNCDYEITREVIPALGHDVKILAAVKPTCTDAGMRQGYYCSRCDGYNIKQDVVPALGHAYDNDEDDTCNTCGHVRVLACKHPNTEAIGTAQDPNCTKAGITAGVKCSDCDEILVPQDIIDALGHVLTSYDAKAATCTDIGWDAYESCSVCDHTTYNEIAKLGHDMITDKAVAPTCTATGLTEGAHCSRCDVKVEQNTVPALGHSFSYIVSGTLTYNVAEGTYSGLTVNGTCATCGEAKTVTEYTVDYVNSAITFGETTLKVESIALNYTSGEHVLAGGTYAGITADGATININAGEVTVNGTVNTTASWIVIDNNATLTVNGTMRIGSSLYASDDGEYASAKHRLFVRQGTLNVNGNAGVGNGLIGTNSLQVGSQRDNTKGYLNINNESGNAIQIIIGGVDDGRWVFANGEVNVTGTGSSKCVSVLRCEGGNGSKSGGNRYVDITYDMKFNVTNFEELIWNGYGRVYAGICPENLVMNNYDNIIWITNNSTAKVYVYSDTCAVIPYTDAETGVRGTALCNLSGLVATYGTNARVATIEAIGFPTADTVDRWTGEIEFIKWVPHTHDYEYGVDGVVIYNVSDGTYDASSVNVGAICQICGAANSDEFTIDVSEAMSEGAYVISGNDRIAIATSLNIVGGEYTLSSGNFESITIDGATVNVAGNVTAKSLTLSNSAHLNFIDGNSVVKGNVSSASSFIVIKNGAVLTVDGGYMNITGDLSSNSSAEYGYNHRLTVLDGTLNINSTVVGKAAIYSNSIQVGSENDNLKGYLNINTAGSGIEIVHGTGGRWVFAAGEMNFTGSVTDGSTYDVLSYPGNSARYTDIESGMKVTAKNFRAFVNNQYGNIYIGFYAEKCTLENIQYVFRDQNTGSRYTYVYVQGFVQVEYTDEDGKTGLANMKCSGQAHKFKNGSIATLADLKYPTPENYGDWANKVFISWVE